MPSLGVPAESAEQIASLLHSNGLISESDFKSAMVSSEEGDKCLIETLIDFRFTDEKAIANAISGSYDIEFLQELSADHIDFTSSDILSKKYKLGRVRILLKQPRTTLSWHRDPEPRLHIPIITNPGAIMVVDNIAKHMPADGSVWITNNTKYHNAFNGGEEDRIHLVACVLNYKFN